MKWIMHKIARIITGEQYRGAIFFILDGTIGRNSFFL